MTGYYIIFHIATSFYQAGSMSKMNGQKRTLSFALNPLTNMIEFISVPEVAAKTEKGPAQSRTLLPKRKANIVLAGERTTQLLRSAETMEEDNVTKQTNIQENYDLNDLLTSIILNVAKDAPLLQAQLEEVLLLAGKTPIDLLVMMDYTQKLSYLRSKCQSQACPIEMLSLEIARVTKLVFREQDIYYAFLCSQFMPELCQ